MKNSRGRSAPRQNITREISDSKIAWDRSSLPATPRFRQVFTALAALTLFIVAGCARKPLTRSQVHVISGEITAAAQDATSRKPDITIRPDFRPVQGAPKSAGPADSISISLDDESHMNALRQAFGEIARRHGLSLAENTVDGVERFNFSYAGTRTHIVYVVTPAAARSRASSLPSVRDSETGPKLAIILDDLGNDRAAADALLALPFPLTISVIPHLPLSESIADDAYRRGDQVYFASADAGGETGCEFRANRVARGHERGAGGGGAKWNARDGAACGWRE